MFCKFAKVIMGLPVLLAAYLAFSAAPGYSVPVERVQSFTEAEIVALLQQGASEYAATESSEPEAGSETILAEAAPVSE